LVTKNLPGTRWLDVLIAASCRVEVCTSENTILDIPTIQKLIGDKCDGVIGQLTESWGALLYVCYPCFLALYLKPRTLQRSAVGAVHRLQ
jgi:hypothetical protein